MAVHLSVLAKETLDLLDPKAGDIALDCTLGLGGHSALILQQVGPKGRLVGLDADETNLASAKERLSSFTSQTTFVHANFRDLPGCLPDDSQLFDCILADLGLSSPHIDDASRGFTFRESSNLDMRFDQSQGMTAAMLIASLDRESLKKIFEEYGELPLAHRLTDALIEQRSLNPVRTSDELKKIAEHVYGYKVNDRLPQIFQALRIAVNNEVAALQNLLMVVPGLLKPNGRLAIISYHSLEDRLVKQAMKQLTTASKDPVTGADTHAPAYELLTQKAIKPSVEEIATNPRSRSARLRAIRRASVYNPHP